MHRNSYSHRYKCKYIHIHSEYNYKDEVNLNLIGLLDKVKATIYLSLMSCRIFQKK